MATTDILDKAHHLLPHAIELRRQIHANPELGNHLPATTDLVEKSLADLNLEIRRSEQTSSFVATLNGEKPGPRLVLRADMDALPMPEDNDLLFASQNPGCMHACGHDAHTAMLVGAAHLLHECRHELAGSVDFFFQTGEEGHFGARIVLDEGLFEEPFEPDAAFAIHISPMLEVGKVIGKAGPMLAAADEFEIEITGKGGHASAPHDCLDPIPVACELVQALSSFVTRRISPSHPVILTVTKIEAGTTFNVIPETVKLTGTLRSISEQSRETAHEGLARISEKIAEAHEMQAHVDLRFGYPVTLNDAGFVEFARDTVADVLGDTAFVEVRSPVMGAEDFSYLLQRWPGAMLFLGVRPEDPILAAPCHSNHMILNEQGMQHGIALHAGIAMNYLA